jgi:hypothetical protein
MLACSWLLRLCPALCLVLMQGAMDSAQRAAVDIALSVKPAGLAAKL